MKLDARLEQIFDKAHSGIQLTREDCAYLLRTDEHSFESGLVRATAADVVRRKNDNSAIILGQIGVDIAPCPGGCKFCTFGDGHTAFQRSQLSQEELAVKMEDFCREGDLYGLYLMTMVPFLTGGDRTVAATYAVTFLFSVLAMYLVFEGLIRLMARGKGSEPWAALILTRPYCAAVIPPLTRMI